MDNSQWDIPGLRRLLEQIVPENTKFEDFQVQAAFPKIGARTMLLNARQTTHKGAATGRILLAFEDVTEQAKSRGQNRWREDREQNPRFGWICFEFRPGRMSCGKNVV